MKWLDVNPQDVVFCESLSGTNTFISLLLISSISENEINFTYVADVDICSSHSGLFDCYSSIRFNDVSELNNDSLTDRVNCDIFTLISINKIKTIEEIKELHPEYFI